MSIAHPAWRFILALTANDMDPQEEGLPCDGGLHTWNNTSRLLSDIVYEDCEHGQVGSLGKGAEYMRVVDAYRFYRMKTHRVYAETYLLAGGDEAWLATALQIDRSVLGAYKSAFFDLSVFRNGIDKLAYIDALPDRKEREVKKGWTKGPDYIRWQMGYEGKPLDAKDAMSNMLTDVYYKHKRSPDGKGAIQRCDAVQKIGKELMGNKDARDLERRIEEILSLETKPSEFKTLEEFNNEGG